MIFLIHRHHHQFNSNRFEMSNIIVVPMLYRVSALSTTKSILYYVYVHDLFSYFIHIYDKIFYSTYIDEKLTYSKHVDNSITSLDQKCCVPCVIIFTKYNKVISKQRLFKAESNNYACYSRYIMIGIKIKHLMCLFQLFV
jgi:hypothetical protein